MITTNLPSIASLSTLQRKEATSQPQDRLETSLRGFAPITLKEMERVALLNRVDVKFLLRIDQLLDILPLLQQDYRALSVNGVVSNRYQTVYFDTSRFDLYHMHINGQAERFKVRRRQYLSTHTTFFEVKQKNRKDRTVKLRIPTHGETGDVTGEEAHWLERVSPFHGEDLIPVLVNTFTRLTLVNRRQCERLTFDIEICFTSERGNVSLPGIVIAEVKRETGEVETAFLREMHRRHIQPQGLSKYAIGISLLYNQIKKNPLKPKLLYLQKMMHGES